MAKNFIEQLKQSGLLGRSGSNFPVWKKWEAVKNAVSNPLLPLRGFGVAKKFVICNAAEGEPMVLKDAFILKNYLSDVVEAIKLAITEVNATQGYIYLNSELYQQHKQKLIKLIGEAPIELFLKPSGYLAGEETSLLNTIEGKPPVPRIKPPYPTEQGLWGCPTLINNAETFYWVNKIAKGQYKNNRFYCISGDVPQKGVFELSESYTIEQVLTETKNYPDFSFFVQVGGGAVGEILTENELQKPINGLASIIVFNKEKTNPMDLMKGLVDFLMLQNCDQCTPCREGLYRINETLQQIQGNLTESQKETLNEIFAVLEKTSLCPFGKTAYQPFKTILGKLF